MVPTGSQHESESIFQPRNTGFSRGVALCMEGGDEDAWAKVKEGEMPADQPVSGSLPSALQ